jgi:hypothetical protein
MPALSLSELKFVRTPHTTPARLTQRPLHTPHTPPHRPAKGSGGAVVSRQRQGRQWGPTEAGGSGGGCSRGPWCWQPWCCSRCSWARRRRGRRCVLGSIDQPRMAVFGKSISDALKQPQPHTTPLPSPSLTIGPDPHPPCLSDGTTAVGSSSSRGRMALGRHRALRQQQRQQ